jgi:hypothetical protein
MSAEPIESLMREMMSQYDRKPEGWTVLIDHRGNVLIIGPKEGYRLKTIQLNPNEYTGVGIKIDDPEELRRVTNEGPSYGFRPLSNNQIRKLFNNQPEGDIQSKIIKKILETKPVPTWELENKNTRAFLSGPIIAHPDLSAISSSQRRLEAKLAVESNRLFRKRYPHRAAIYG